MLNRSVVPAGVRKFFLRLLPVLVFFLPLLPAVSCLSPVFLLAGLVRFNPCGGSSASVFSSGACPAAVAPSFMFLSLVLALLVSSCSSSLFLVFFSQLRCGGGPIFPVLPGWPSL